MKTDIIDREFICDIVKSVVRYYCDYAIIVDETDYYITFLINTMAPDEAENVLDGCSHLIDHEIMKYCGKRNITPIVFYYIAEDHEGVKMYVNVEELIYE